MARAQSPLSSLMSYTPRMQAAFARADESAQRLQRVAIALGDEIDDVTAPHGMQTANFDEEDSMVTTLDKVIADREAQVAERKAQKG